MLREVLPIVDVAAGVAEASPSVGYPSPGLMSKHYAPRAPLTLYSGDPEAALDALLEQARLAVTEGRRVGAIVPHDDAARLRDLPIVLADVGAHRDPEAMAQRLYAALRELDAARVDLILACDTFGDEGIGRAIRDRLRRAASAHVIVEPRS
jgi:L-threonylcarbamoyladenylate synthase